MTTVLIVDDEPAVRALIGRWLRAHRCSVREAASAGEALDRMAEDAADIALCDVALPDRNGLWLAGQMRRQFPNTALVLMTDFGLTAVPSNVDSAAIGYLPKPFSEQELLRTLDWAMGWRHEQMPA